MYRFILVRVCACVNAHYHSCPDRNEISTQLTVNSTESRDATQIYTKARFPFTHLEYLCMQNAYARADHAPAESAQPRILTRSSLGPRPHPLRGKGSGVVGYRSDQGRSGNGRLRMRILVL